jgi:2-polyprenyl-3-methyl-5-hydroxy-6-metoxy-1,4-benzoquinol methylase
MSDTRSFYDASAAETAEEWYRNPVLLPTLKEFVSLLPRKPRVLDLGCGAGYESMRLHSLGAEVVGIDYSAECVRIAKEKNPGCRFFEMDFFSIDKGLGSFDGIWSSGSLIHVPHDRMGDLLSRLAPRLRSSGVFCAVTREGSGRRVTSHTVNGKTYQRIVYLYSWADLITSFQSHGMELIKKGVLDNDLTQKGWMCMLFRKSAE